MDEAGAARASQTSAAVPARSEPTTLRSLVAHPRARVVLAALTLTLSVLAFSIWTHHRVGQIVKSQVGQVLHVTLDAATEGVRLWVESAERAADSAAQDSVVGGLLATCFAAQGNCDSRALDGKLAPYLHAGGFVRFAAIDGNGALRASGPIGDFGLVLPSVDASLRKTSRAIALPPVLAAGHPVLLVFAPIGGAAGSPLGALWFELPAEGFGRILRAARAGHTGETYAFDAHGRLLSDSRFVDQLRDAGLLAPTAHSAVLALELRDPGGDLTRGFVAPLPRARQPLTRMAASAVRGHAGLDVKGYRDYRGVPVVGAWEWFSAINIGIASEVDVAEAYRTLNGLGDIFTSVVIALALAAASLLGATIVTARLRSRVRHAERAASRFGQYRIVRKIGEGGMGSVYLASHELLRRPAAIKLLRADRADHAAAARFEREVRLTSSLTHPNTVAVYDYGRADDGTFYYAMEYLEGLDLQTMVARFGPLPQARVIHLLRQVCGSLAEAHAAGLIHRDIKPGNLLICTRGGVGDVVKVLDFGVALSLRREIGLEAKDKVLFGTPEFMAPEMFESAEQASAQSDVYAVGVVAYFLLTGAPPFEGGTTAELCRAHLMQAPEPLAEQLGANADGVLVAAVMACLNKRGSARPSSALALRALLERSPLAGAWTQAEADAWWAGRAGQIAEMRASSPHAAIAPEMRTMRPAKQA